MSRIRLYRTEAVVLKRRDFGEADRLLTLYSLDRGKISAIAKGVRRIASRKSGHLELFTRSTLLLAQGRNLDVVTQAETVEAYPALRGDLVRTAYGYHVAELVDRFTEEGAPSPPVFELLCQALAALGGEEDPTLLARFFELRLLGHLGYRPRLFDCALCRAELEPEGNVYSPDAGGVLCPRCAGRAADAIPLGAAEFRVLRFLQSRDWAMVRRIALTPVTRTALERVSHATLRHLLEGELYSASFLKRLGQVAERLELQPSAPRPAAAPRAGLVRATKPMD